MTHWFLLDTKNNYLNMKSKLYNKFVNHLDKQILSGIKLSRDITKFNLKIRINKEIWNIY